MDENQVEALEPQAPQIAQQPVQQPPVAEPVCQQEPIYQQPPVQQPYYPQQPVYPQPPVQQPYYPQQPVYPQPPVQQPYYPQQPVYAEPYYPQQPLYPQATAPAPYLEQEPNWEEVESTSFRKALTALIASMFPVGSIISIVAGAKGRGIAARAISYANRHNIPVRNKIKTAAGMAKAGMVTGIVFTAIYAFILLVIYNVLLEQVYI